MDSTEWTSNSIGFDSSVLSSVRNHIPSWLTGGKFLGGKDETAPKPDEGAAPGATSAGDVSPSKESDASSATGGADSDKEVGPESSPSFSSYLFILLAFDGFNGFLFLIFPA